MIEVKVGQVPYFAEVQVVKVNWYNKLFFNNFFDWKKNQTQRIPIRALCLALHDIRIGQEILSFNFCPLRMQVNINRLTPAGLPLELLLIKNTLSQTKTLFK